MRKAPSRNKTEWPDADSRKGQISRTSPRRSSRQPRHGLTTIRGKCLIFSPRRRCLPPFSRRRPAYYSASLKKVKNIFAFLLTFCEKLPVFYTVKHFNDAIKSKDKHSHKHGLDISLIKKIPTLIYNPVMIFDSTTKQDSIIIITHLFHFSYYFWVHLLELFSDSISNTK